MGHAAHFNLANLRTRYGLGVFWETGTGGGDSVQAALDAGFPSVISAEIVREIHVAAQGRFRDDPRVSLQFGSSSRWFPNARFIPERILFWLDAHLEGIGYTTTDAWAQPDIDLRLPLEQELLTIVADRPAGQDVILIDDARLYVEGPYGGGPLPAWAQTLPPERRNIDFIYRLLNTTHEINIDYADEGYVVCLPRGGTCP